MPKSSEFKRLAFCLFVLVIFLKFELKKNILIKVCNGFGSRLSKDKSQKAISTAANYILDDNNNSVRNTLSKKQAYLLLWLKRDFKVN